jgi:RNA ligase
MMFTLQDAMKALEGREEFAVKRLDGLVIVNYLVTLPDSFEGIRENFRGVVFDETSGQIVSLPLHKFYNVNQKDHTQLHVIGDETALVFEKFDGTMTHALEVNGNVVLASRMGWDTEQSIAATRLMKRLGMLEAVEREVKEGRTPIFEYVGPNNPVVIHYPKEDLVYLWSRDRKTGLYTRGLDSQFHRHQSRSLTVKALMDEVLTLEDKEGYVCVLPDLWVKAKSPWYLDRHRAFDMLMKPAYRLYEVGLQGKLDDLIAQAADLFKPKLEQILLEVGKDQIRLHRELQEGYDALLANVPAGASAHERRKAFAIAAKSHPHFGGLMLKFSNREVDDWIATFLFDFYKAKYPGRLFSNLPDEP